MHHEISPPPAGARPRGGRGGPVDHRLYVHVAWPTLGRLPLVGPRRALAVEGHLVSLCRRLDVEPVEVLVASDRVHILMRFKPTQPLGTLVQRIKEGTEEVLVRAQTPVRWGRGFALASVSPADVRRLKRELVTRPPGMRPSPAGRLTAPREGG